MILFTVIIILIVFIGCYFYNPLKKPMRTFAKYFPYPVAVVEGKIITSAEIIEDALAVKNFYQSQDFSTVGMRIDFDTSQGKERLKIKEKDVLDKKIENLIVVKLANERGIIISKADVRQMLDRQIQEAGNAQAFEANLKKIYGWNVENFRDKVVLPQLYMRKLADYYFENEMDKGEEHQIIEKARQELKADGSNFDDIAKKYSQGKSANSEGELGWFREDQLAPEVARAVFELKEGEISNVIKSSLGYHIVQAQQFRQVKAAGEDGQQPDGSGNGSETVREVKIRQIFVAEKGFISWLFEQKKKMKVMVLAREYKWEAEEAKLIFAEEKMNKAEENLRAKAQGDPSMD